MICVDSSVWVEAFRGSARITSALDKLIEDDRVLLVAPVQAELLAGASKRDVGKLSRVLNAVQRAVPSEQTWETVFAWLTTANAAGERFGAMELLIAATATEHNARIWSLDAAFARMERLRLCTRYAP